MTEEEIDLKGADLVADTLNDFRLIQILNSIHRRERKIQSSVLEIEGVLSPQLSSQLLGLVGIAAALASVALAIENISFEFVIFGGALIFVVGALAILYWFEWREKVKERRKKRTEDEKGRLRDSIKEFEVEKLMLDELKYKLDNLIKEENISKDLHEKKMNQMNKIRSFIDKKISYHEKEIAKLERN